MNRLLICAGLLTLSIGVGKAEIKGREVTYTSNGVTLKGFLAYDDAKKEKRPGVLVVHEWWGHNEYARKRARMLAELGYVAMAVDMYGEGKQATHPSDAGKFASAVMQDMDTMKARFEAAMHVLKQQPQTDQKQIAAIGYCFGGGVVLNMARQGENLKGVVSFHGSLGTSSPAQAGKVKAKMLVCHGAADEFSSAEQIAAFKSEMDSAKVDYQFIAYEGAKHSFTNPDADAFAEKFGIPLAYNEKADKQSWQDMQTFFKKIFAK